MNLEKVFFGFFIVLALTLNVAFVAGELNNPEHHSIWLLFSAVVVNLIATVLKLGDRSQIGALLLATALVADLQLFASALIWTLWNSICSASVIEIPFFAVITALVSVTSRSGISGNPLQ